MKTSRQILICIACLSAVAYCIYATMSVRHLEAESRHERLVRDAASVPPRLSYGFDDSFRDYFGEQRVAIIEAALDVGLLRGMTDPDEMLRYATREYRVGYELR